MYHASYSHIWVLTRTELHGIHPSTVVLGVDATPYALQEKMVRAALDHMDYQRKYGAKDLAVREPRFDVRGDGDHKFIWLYDATMVWDLKCVRLDGLTLIEEEDE